MLIHIYNIIIKKSKKKRVCVYVCACAFIRLNEAQKPTFKVKVRSAKEKQRGFWKDLNKNCTNADTHTNTALILL